MPIPLDTNFANDQTPAGSAEQPCCMYTAICADNLLAAQYHAVRIVAFSAAFNGVQVAIPGNGQKPMGILQDPGAVNDVVQVMVEGKSKAVIGQNVTFWTNWQSNGLGHLVPLAAGSWSGGRFLESANQCATPTLSELTTVFVGCHNPWYAVQGFVDEAGR